MMGIRLALTGAAMVTIMVVAACGGENLFSVAGNGGGVSGGTDTEAPGVTINSPRGDSLSAKPVGDSVFVSAHVTDDVGVRSVRMYGIAMRGDPSLGTEEVVDRFVEKDVTLPAGVKDTTINRYLQPTPDSVRELAYIVVAAADSAGNETADTVQLLLGGPDVVLLDIVDGQSVQAGLNLTTRVRAMDPQGIIQIRVDVDGAFQASVVKAIAPVADSVVLDTIIPIPQGTDGPVTVTAVARNSLDISGQDGPITLNVVTAGGGDTIAPALRHVSAAPARMELQDVINVEITGGDNPQGSGLAAVGYTVKAISPTRGDTLVRSGSMAYDPPRTGTVTASFDVPVFNVDSLSLPDTLVFEITSWMKDVEGNCAASVGVDSVQSLPCGQLTSGETVAQSRNGQRLTRSIVAGKTVLLPSGGKVMDAAVDTARRKLYLSNISNNRLEVFDLFGETFQTAIGVGSEPWGLAFTPDNQYLWVANSGGTNLSKVDLDAAKEVDSDRFLTPDVVLFDVELRTGDAGVQYLVTPYPQPAGPSFSDRPQYVAVDSFGNLIFSTRVTDLGTLGTARKGYVAPGWQRSEAKMFVEQGEPEIQENFWAIAHIDSIETKIDTIGTDSLGEVITSATLGLFDHVPGFPDQVIVGRAKGGLLSAMDSAINSARDQGSDLLVYYSAKWNIPNITFQDTTYVAGSGDGGWVAVGEGGTSSAGRVLTYEAKPLEVTSLSRWIQVSDLLTNPAEEVRGIGLNYDGTLGVVRGRLAAYFMSPPDLRLQGLTEIPQAGIGKGATLHPLHANARTLDNLAGQYRPDTHLAFVGTGDHTVDIIDTQRFSRVGRVYIRDVINGPLRAVLPFPEDNANFRCATIPVTDKRGTYIGNAVQIYNNNNFNDPIPPDGITEDRCVVMKLFASTDAGGVVVVDVRKADVLREHPDRP
ncbi:MAG: hypothetical protein PVJ02_01015 [Gemmatimonadota bacterium]|jgi:hypothetical protein